MFFKTLSLQYVQQFATKSMRPIWPLHLVRRSVVRPSSNGEGIRDIQYRMNMLLDTRIHIWFIITGYYKMRQKPITKFVRFFYYKRWQFDYKIRQLLQNANLLQIATVHNNSFPIMNCQICLHKFEFHTGLITLLFSKQPKRNCSYSELASLKGPGGCDSSD